MTFKFLYSGILVFLKGKVVQMRMKNSDNVNRDRFIIMCLAFMAFVNAHGQTWSETSLKYPDRDIRPGDSFGFSISMDGDYAVVGAPFYDIDRHKDAGKAFILKKVDGRWDIIHELENPVPREGSLFGFSVLMKGAQVFVGAPSPFSQEREGMVCHFTPNSGTWDGSVSRYVIYNPRKESGDGFGASLAMVRDVLAVGAPTASGSSGRNGAVQLFDGSELRSKTFIKSIFPSSTDVSNFGASVAGNTKYLFATAPGDNESQPRGAAFIFDYMEGFTEIAKLESPDGAERNFGTLSAASSDTYAITSLSSNANGSVGAVYIFSEGSGWNTVASPECVFTPREFVSSNSRYGAALLLTEETLYIGYEGHYVEMLSKMDGWRSDTPSVLIRGEHRDEATSFGKGIATNGSDLLIGDHMYEKWGTSSGVVFAFNGHPPQKYSETYQGTLSADYDHFGSEVDVYGNYAVVAAVNDAVNGWSSGSAYVYHYDFETEWTRVAKLQPSDGGPFHSFGSSVSITEDRIVISAPGADSTNHRSGKVYIFEKPAEGWRDMTETSVITRVNDEKGKFGYQVAVANDEIAITQVYEEQSSAVGYAYIFKKEGNLWALKAELNPYQRTVEYAASFGYSLAYDGETVVIGSPFAANSNGAVFVFQKFFEGWSQSQTEDALLTTNDGPFAVGYSVDVYEGQVISGGLGNGETGNTGAGYIFEKGTAWQNSTAKAKLIGYTNGEATLGYDVCLTDDFAIVSGTGYLVDHWSFFLFRRVNGEWEDTTPHFFETSYYKPAKRGLRLAAWDEHLIVGAENAHTHTGVQSGIVEFRIKSPTVRRVTTAAPDRKYKAGDVIDIQVEFSQPVRIVEGTPTGLALIMHDNSVRVASYVGLTDNLKLNFRYTVGLNDSTPRLNYENEMSLLGDFTPRTIKRGWIGFKDLPHPGLNRSLGGRHFLVIDGDYTEPVPEEPVEEIPVSVEKGLEGLYAFPNPYNHSFRVPAESTNVTLTDLAGRVVYQSSHRPVIIETPGLRPGLYILRMWVGSKIYALKIEKL